MRFLLLFILALAFPASAQQLSADYKVIGQMDTVYDGVATDFYVATMPDSGTSFAEIKVLMGQQMLQISGIRASEEGDYSRPILSFTISLKGDGLGMMHSLSILEAERDQKHPTETGMMDGSLQITNFSKSGGTISFDFTASATRFVLDDAWDQTPEVGMGPLDVSGHVALEIPPEFIEES